MHDHDTEPLLPATKGLKSAWFLELKALLSLSGPAIIQLAGQQGLVVTNQIIIGHIGAVELAAAAIGNAGHDTAYFKDQPFNPQCHMLSSTLCLCRDKALLPACRP